MKNKIVTVIVSLAGVFSSCNKIVDLNSPTAVLPDKFYKTESDIKYAITGVYGLLRTNYSIYYQMGEMPSDNVETRFESEGALGFWDKLTWTAYTTNFEDIWINFYNTIAQCNLVLSKLEGVTFMSASTKAQYVAELKFIRSLMYFELVHFFGEVPLVLDVVTNDQQAFVLTRRPVAEIYAQIEKDLMAAEGSLPPVYATVADKGRVTSIAVKALLGKAYLFQKKYADAEKKFSEVINNSNYGLMPNPGDVFSITDEYNKEVIFTIQYSRVLIGVGEGSSFAASFLPEGSGLTTVSNSSANLGTLDLYRLFKAGDKRKDLIGILRRNDTTDSTSFNFYFYTKKFTDNPPSREDGENNWIVIRYADVVLLYAEALNEQQGKTADAVTEVNKVRVRAGAVLLATTLPQDQTRASIKNERRLELCFEAHRWPDLVRWEDYLTVMNAFKVKYGVTAMLPNDYGKLFPIPNRERVINPALTQNSGY